MKKAFTLIELVTAVAILAMVLSFTGVIFKVSIGTYRTAGANAEIMQKLRAITDQLNRDFKGLRKDGYLKLHYDVRGNRREYPNSAPCDFRADRIYYFSTGDFQSWFGPDIRSNIARVYFGHDSISLSDDSIPVSQWILARDAMLITPDQPGIPDCNEVSYAGFKVDVNSVLSNDVDNLLLNPGVGVPIDVSYDANSIRSLMCENVGEIIIQWTDDGLVWSRPPLLPWTPSTDWPKALRFTFTLYDSKGILENGRRFTHIVYVK